MKQPLVAKEPRRKKRSEPIQSPELDVLQKEPVHSQPVSPPDDRQARIADCAYGLYAERGYRQGYALDDWLDAQREILGLECSA
jgi:hypothetical protein